MELMHLAMAVVAICVLGTLFLAWQLWRETR